MQYLTPSSNPYTTRSVAAAEFGLDRMQYGQGTPLQRYAQPQQYRAAQLRSLSNARPDFPWHGQQTESQLGLPMHEYASTSSSARCLSLTQENEKLKAELRAYRTVNPRLEDLDQTQEANRVILRQEEQNMWLQEQLSHLKGELKAAGPRLEGDHSTLIADLQKQVASLQAQADSDALNRLQNEEIIAARQGEIVELKARFAAGGSNEALIAKQQEELADLRVRLAAAGSGPLVAQLRTEVEAGLDMIARQQDELNSLNARMSTKNNGLNSDFDFGRRVYQCAVPAPGVGYRHTPQFADKNKDGCGPQYPQVLIADDICQGPSAVFVKCSSGNGWIPLSNPDGKQQILRHIGKESELNMADYQIADGKSKIVRNKGSWFGDSPQRSPQQPSPQDNLKSPSPEVEVKAPKMPSTEAEVKAPKMPSVECEVEVEVKAP